MFLYYLFFFFFFFFFQAEDGIRDGHVTGVQTCALPIYIDVPIGRIVYTQWLNERGGIEADLTVTREAEDAYLVVTSCATQTRDFSWLCRSIPAEARAVALDVSPAYAVLGLMGPQSRELLATLTDADLSSAAFPFATSQVIDLG